MTYFEEQVNDMIRTAHGLRIIGSPKSLVRLMDDIDTAIRGLQGVRKQIRREFPGLSNYDRNGNWIGPVANENGWTP